MVIIDVQFMNIYILPKTNFSAFEIMCFFSRLMLVATVVMIR